MLFALIASIPSPPFNQIGPFRLYGLCIAAGVIAAVMISSKRWEARGGDPDDIGAIAVWAVPAGVIGARIYHVATDWKIYQDDWLGAFKIWNGGLGIPGGIFFGVLVGLLVVRARKLPALVLLDVAAPAIPVAQAIGRLGNYFNQEVFGKPTTLPWGLEIDPAVSPVANQYPPGTTFHPTFLYEGLWNVALALLLVWLGRRRQLRPGQLFTLYVLGYALGRLWVEGLRSDPASLILGIRVNIWMSVIVGLVALAVFLRNRRRPMPARATAGVVAADGDEAVLTAGGDDGRAEHQTSASPDLVEGAEPAGEPGGEADRPGDGEQAEAGDDDGNPLDR